MIVQFLAAATIFAQINVNFPLVNIKGDTVWFSSFRGKPLVVIFWSPWCPHCQHELPEITKLYEKYHPQGVNFIGITRADSAVLEENIRKHHIQYPEFVNIREVINQPIFGEIPGVPTTFIFDSEGKLYFKQIGYVPADTFDQKLAELVAKEKMANHAIEKKHGLFYKIKKLLGIVEE